MTVGFLCAAILLAAGAAQAAITIDTVTVGNPGNAGELSGVSVPGGYGPDRICGAVAYTYNIGKYEVTAGQYTAFLNAVAKTDTYALYNTDMSRTDYGSGIARSGSSGSYSYSVETAFTNRPVNYVSWGDSARFANWLHNGQPTDAQGLTTTEDGAYYLNCATTDPQLLAVNRETDWKWAITSEDEWYKAAYHDKTAGLAATYFDYPTSSNTAPGQDMADASGNNANYYADPIDSPYYTTLAGEFQNSDSPYGTFDQGGNVWEWNEAILYGAYCGLRGGSFLSHSIDTLHASYRYGNIPTGQISYIGFRVCEALEQIMGDLDHDGDVDIFDWAIFQPNYGTMSDMSYDDGDLDGDADVDMFDWALFQPMYGIGTDGEPVPEPLTLSLLALGCLRLSTVNVTPDRRCWHQPDLWYRSRGVLACGCRQGSFRGSPRYHRPFRPVLSVARRWVDPRRLRQGFLADFQRHHRNLP